MWILTRVLFSFFMIYLQGHANASPLHLVLVHHPACGYCRKLDSEVIPEVIDHFKHKGYDVNLELIDWSDPLQQSIYHAMQMTHEVRDENITGYPILIILNQDGTEHINCRVHGYMPKNLYIHSLETRIPSCA